MKRRAFTLIELLVVIGIIALLVSILAPSLSRVRDLARSSVCLTHLRSIAIATHLYAQENNDFLPASQMFGVYHKVLPWEKSIVPEMGGNIKDVVTTGGKYNSHFLNSLLNGLYRCPSDKRKLASAAEDESTYVLSYGENSYFEIDPALGIDYPGSPATWRTTSKVLKAASTVFYGELAITAPMNDHFMPYYYSSDADADKEIDGLRHITGSNYAFVDGHAAIKPKDEIFKWDDDPAKRTDQFCPFLAR